MSPDARPQSRDVARDLGLAGKFKIGIVTGDDILDRLDELSGRGIELRNMDTDEPLSTVRDRIQSANAYLGAEPIVEALEPRRAGSHHRTRDGHGSDAGADDS